MATLLTLPREIRDQIFAILLHESSAATLPNVAGVQKLNNRRDPSDTTAWKIRYPSQTSSKNLIQPLVLVNRQFYEESQEAILHYQKCGAATVTLDLLLGDNKWLYPTWINVLPYSPVIKKMHIQIRNFAGTDDSDIDGFSATWRLGYLCNNFLERGIALIEGTRRVFVIENLVVDSVSDLQLNDSRLHPHVARHRKNLRRFLINDIDGFLVVRDKRWHVPWGPVLLSRVRKLSIAVDGTVVKEIDVLERAKACGIKAEEAPLERRKF